MTFCKKKKKTVLRGENEFSIFKSGSCIIAGASSSVREFLFEPRR